MKEQRDTELIVLYFSRDSFCMADDCMAPNMARYEWKSRYDKEEFSRMVRSYLGGLPPFHWRGYAGGKSVVDIVFKNKMGSRSGRIQLQDDWKTRLLQERSLWFLHCSSDSDDLPETAARCYSFEEAEEIFNQYFRPRR